MANEPSPRSSLDVPPNDGNPFPTRRRSQDTAPPRYSEEYERGRTNTHDQWRSQDPRSSSTQSLRPTESTRDGRRTLLLVYIHGFMGNEMSFQSFPAHVHNLLSILISETHVLHTKLYPRYKSRKAIEFARDDFSQWLEPNETPQTDVVLLGHSMGGILAAEVALLPPHSPATGQPFRHRILGTIGFDTPYLGMHPGVIVSGISSLFRPAPPEFNSQPRRGSLVHNVQTSPSTLSLTSTSTLEQPLSQQTSASASTTLSPTLSHASTMSTVPTNDPYYDPPFPNDKHLAERKGWDSVLHFINKHSDGLTKATRQYFMSHLEFGGCLADYPGLRNRYVKIRELEDVDDLSQREGPGPKPMIRRIRFLNYWTASTGIPKKPRAPSGQMIDKNGHLMPIEAETKDTSLSDTSSRSVTPTPSISVEEYSDGALAKRDIAEVPEHEPSAMKAQIRNLGEDSEVHEADSDAPPEMRHIDSMPIEEDKEPTNRAPDSQNPASAELLDEGFERRDSEPPMPPLPAVPEEPQPIDLALYTDKDSRKIAEKEQKRVMKAYQQAVKDRENAIKDRRKLLEKRQKKARQEQEKRLKAEQKQRLKEEKEEDVRQNTVNPPPKDQAPKEEKAPVEKPTKDRKFCMMPPEINGRLDKCWVRVYMEGVDEVGAHCRLFLTGAHYESLVGDVGARVEEWVKEDATRRVILEGETESHEH